MKLHRETEPVTSLRTYVFTIFPLLNFFVEFILIIISKVDQLRWTTDNGFAPCCCKQVSKLHRIIFANL
jgi:hypothetical protein